MLVLSQCLLLALRRHVFFWYVVSTETVCWFCHEIFVVSTETVCWFCLKVFVVSTEMVCWFCLSVCC